MSLELESMWDAMKGVHYRRTIEQMERSIADIKNLDDALGVSLEMVVKAVHAVAGTFWFFDRFKDGRIWPRAAYGGGNLTGFSLLPGEGIAGEVIESGKSVIIADCRKDPRWAGRADKTTGFKTETMICVPLALGTIVFGCIQIINKTDKPPFDEKDLAFAERLAGATADLFRRHGLLDDYLAAADSAGLFRTEVTFMQVFGAENEREMNRQIRRLDEFSALRVSEQEAALKAARELYAFFGGKNGGAGESTADGGNRRRGRK